MKHILLVGAGGHCKSVIDVIESSSSFSIYGLLGNPSEVGSTVLGYKVLGTDNDLSTFRSQCEHAFLAIGSIRSSTKRRQISEKLITQGFQTPSIVSDYAYVSHHASISHGTFIGHGAIINANARIGAFCIVNSMSLVEHDAIVDDFAHLSTNTTLNGAAQIGSGSFLGSHSFVREGVKIPQDTLISAGKRVMGWPIRLTHSHE